MKSHTFPAAVLLFSLLLVSSALVSVRGVYSVEKYVPSFGTIYSIGWLHTEGSKIKDEYGNTMRLVGANVDLYTYLETDSLLQHPDKIDEVLNAIKNAGANLVKLNIPFDMIPGFPDQAPPPEWYMDKLDEVVEISGSLRLHVLIEYFFCWRGWNQGSTNAYLKYFNPDHPERLVAMANAVMTVVNRYKDNPTVCGHSPINEPAGPSGYGHDDGYWWDLLDAYYDEVIPRIQAAQPNLLISLGSPNWCGYPVYWWTKYAFRTESNILYEWHHYYHYSDWGPYLTYKNGGRDKAGIENHFRDSALKIMTNYNKPVFKGECGVYCDPADPYWETYMPDEYSLLADYGVSFAQWDMTAYDGWAMMTDWSGALNPVGVVWKANLGL